MLDYVEHSFAPVFDSESRVLILGTMPSPTSRERGFYYSHPRNRFWQVMTMLFGGELPQTPDERRAYALRHRFALWDVLASCEIKGASDASIRNPIVNDIGMILSAASIGAVFTTGQKASQLYRRYCVPQGLPQNIPLPSTSPANAGMALEKLTEEYSVILNAVSPAEKHFFE